MSSAIGLLFVLLVWFWVQVLPGYALSRWVAPELRGLARWTLALFCGWSVIPLGIFLLAVAAGVPMDPTLLLLASTLINLTAGAILMPWKNPQVGRRDSLAVCVALLASALFIAFAVRSLDGGDVFSTVHHCLYVIVMHTIANDPSVSVPLYDAMSDGTMHYLVHHPVGQFNGLAPLFFEQRLGNAPILSPFVALFGTFGWYWASVVTTALTGLLLYQCARTLNVRPAPAVLAAVLFSWGMRVFCMYYVNENTYAVALVTFLIWGALRADYRWSWVILLGIAAGHLVGVRYTSVLFLPAVALAALWRSAPGRERLIRFAGGAAVVVLTVLPWLYVNWIMLGDPFTHPKIHSEHEGRVVANALFGLEFEFRALNWPFTAEWVRTPWNPFPTQVWLPLRVAECFGQLPLAIAVLGTWAAVWSRTTRRAGLLLLTFALPHTLAIAWLETLDWEQLTYAAPGLVPLGIFLAAGLDTLWTRRTGLGVRVLITGVALAAIVGGSYAVRALDRPADRRMLDPQEWAEAPAQTEGTRLVAERLTAFAPLPRIPRFRTNTAGHLWASLTALPPDDLLYDGQRPLYPSGRVAVLAGYAQKEDVDYRFSVAPGPLRAPDEPVRTSLGLHQVSLKLKAERLDVDIVRRQASYEIAVTPVGDGTQERDFTFWLHPWMPPVESITLTLEGEPLPGVRTLTYGGTLDEDQLRFVITNYPPEIMDVMALDYHIEGELPGGCGLFLFLTGVDATDIETLVLAGGHDTFWHGERSGTLRVPRNLRADGLVLYVDPYCSTHVPQYGDPYALAKGPFYPGETVRLEFQRRW